MPPRTDIVEEPQPAVDMSAAAIAERIATVGQLYRVCLSLMAARPVVRAEAKPGEAPAAAGETPC